MSRTLASRRLINFFNQSQDTVVLSADAVLDHKAVDAMYVISYIPLFQIQLGSLDPVS